MTVAATAPTVAGAGAGGSIVTIPIAATAAAGNPAATGPVAQATSFGTPQWVWTALAGAVTALIALALAVCRPVFRPVTADV